MKLGQVALRRHRIARMQLPSIDAPANGALDPLVRRHSVAILRWHDLPRTGPGLVRARLDGINSHNKNDISFRPCLKEGCAPGVPKRDPGCYRAGYSQCYSPLSCES